MTIILVFEFFKSKSKKVKINPEKRNAFSFNGEQKIVTDVGSFYDGNTNENFLVFDLKFAQEAAAPKQKNTQKFKIQERGEGW